ncbi:MAG TPA: CsbD family protein [Myxococcales bacterium]|nr:CsbD family protein [Myxococcales bacterium]
MDKKNLEGGLDNLKGRVKETVGVATGDRQMEGEGKLDQIKGKVKDAAGNLREGIKDKLDDLDRDKDDK